MRRFIVLLVVAVVGIGLPAAVAGAKTPQPDIVCGVPITTSVYLRHNMTCPSFNIEAPGPVVIDLRGHTLTGYFFGNETSFTVRNGTIVGRVLMGWPFASTSDTMSHVHVTCATPPCESSLSVDVEGQTAHIRNSVIDGGVNLEGQTDVVTGSHIGGGLGVSDSDFDATPTITGDWITGGIVVKTATGGGGEIARNVVTDGPIEISQGPSLPFLIAHNLVTNSPSYGIVVYSYPLVGTGYVTLRANTVVDNAQGIYVQPPGNQVIDGGRNIATGNGGTQQCIGVSCGS